MLVLVDLEYLMLPLVDRLAVVLLPDKILISGRWVILIEVRVDLFILE